MRFDSNSHLVKLSTQVKIYPQFREMETEVHGRYLSTDTSACKQWS